MRGEFKGFFIMKQMYNEALTKLFSTTSRVYPYTSFEVLLWPLSAWFSYNRTEHSQGTLYLLHVIKKQFAVNNLYLFLLERKTEGSCNYFK